MAMQVSVMHAFIDEGDYSSMTIDKALRKMLKDFKLPGELVWPHPGRPKHASCQSMLATSWATLYSHYIESCQGGCAC